MPAQLDIVFTGGDGVSCTFSGVVVTARSVSDAVEVALVEGGFSCRCTAPVACFDSSSAVMRDVSVCNCCAMLVMETAMQ